MQAKGEHEEGDAADLKAMVQQQQVHATLPARHLDQLKDAISTAHQCKPSTSCVALLIAVLGVSNVVLAMQSSLFALALHHRCWLMTFVFIQELLTDLKKQLTEKADKLIKSEQEVAVGKLDVSRGQVWTSLDFIDYANQRLSVGHKLQCPTIMSDAMFALVAV